MIDRSLKDPVVSERHIESVLGAQLKTFMSVVSNLGYSPSTIRTQLQLLTNFVRWIQENDVGISNIDKSITDRFLTESDRKGALRRGDNKTLRHFLTHLRAEGIILCPEPVFNGTPSDISQKPVQRLPTKGTWALNGDCIPVLALPPAIPS